MLNNALTKGTNPGCYGIPINEDKAIVVQVTDYNYEYNVVTGKKVWDTSSKPQLFYAWNKNKHAIFKNQYVVFHRVGEFEQNPPTWPLDLALRDPDPKKISWFCESGLPSGLIYDNGNGTGKQVTYQNGSFQDDPLSETLPLVSGTDSHLFHGYIPPFSKGRVYFGQRIGNQYFVFLEGLGPKAQTYQYNTQNDTKKFTIEFDLTADGRVIDFRVSAETLIDDPVVYEENISGSWYLYDGAGDLFSAFNAPYEDYPYVAIVTGITSSTGVRKGGQYIFTYEVSPTGGVLPGNFASKGANYVCYSVSNTYKEYNHPTWGVTVKIVYADRTPANWKQWRFDLSPNAWDDIVQNFSTIRCIDYRSDENPIAVRQSNYGSIKATVL